MLADNSTLFLCAATDQGRCSMFPTRENALRLDIRACILLTAVLTCCALPAPAETPTATPQIQGGNLRIEFDNHMRGRVVARFDNKETVLGPFTASETVTTSGRLRTEFVLSSQKQ